MLSCLMGQGGQMNTAVYTKDTEIKAPVATVGAEGMIVLGFLSLPVKSGCCVVLFIV